MLYEVITVAKLQDRATEMVERLGHQAAELGDRLEQAERRLETADGLATDLDDRSVGLRAVAERLDAFEGRLAEWRSVEQQLDQAFESAATRRGAIQGLEQQIRA